MKKILTLGFALFCAMASFAQDDFDPKGAFEFVDKDGNVVPSGSVLTRTELEENELGSMQINSGLYAKQVVKDIEGAPLGVAMYLSASRIDHGDLQYCFPGSCYILSEVGDRQTAPEEMKSEIASIQTEWIPGVDDEDGETPLKGQATVTFSLHAFDGDIDLGESTSVTVNFVNEKSTGINEVNSDANATVVARYSVDGTRLSQPQKGLNIVKLSNGKTVKYVK